MKPTKEPDEDAQQLKLDSPSLTITETNQLIGTTIGGHFKIKSKLGSGGMSTVYRASHLLMNQRDVAIKVMHPGLVDQNTLKRFQQEASATARFSHPNAISLISYGISDNGLPYIVLELCEGESLSSWIASDKDKNWRTCVEIMLPICGALAEAHKNGIVHRDLKPSNIMLLNDGNKFVVKVLDFGIARMIGKDDGQLAGLTQTGEVLGSPQYMSPEQCQGMKVDDRSDIYSLGCVMYEVLTGTKAVTGDNSFAVMHHHLELTPPSFSAVASKTSIPPRLEEIVFKCLEKRAEQRYQSMGELEQELEALSTSNATDLGFFEMARPMLRQLGRNKRQVIQSLVIAGVLCLAGAASYYWGLPWFYEREWTTEFAAGKGAAKKFDLDAATKHFVNSNQAASHFDAHKEHKMKTLTELAVVYARRGQYKDMDLCLNQIKVIQNDLNRFNSAVFTPQDLKELAATRLREAPQKIEGGKHERTYLGWIKKLDDTAMLCAKGGLPEQARQLMEKSEQLQAGLQGSATVLVTNNNNLGVSYAMTGKFELAERHFTEAYRIAKRTNDLPPNLWMTTHANMGRLYTHKKNFAAAEEVLQAALDAGAKSGPSVTPEMIETLKNFAGLRQAQGREADARKFEQDAKKLESTPD